VFDPDEQQEVTAATQRVRSKITKGARGGYGIEQTIELACPVSHWMKDRATGAIHAIVVIGYDQEGNPITARYDVLYAAALAQAGESLTTEVKRRQQSEGGLHITEGE